MGSSSTEQGHDFYRTPKWFGTTVFVLVNCSFALGASAVFAVNSSWRWPIGVALVLLVIWWIACLKSSRKEDRAKDNEISRLGTKLQHTKDHVEFEHRTRFANAVGAMFAHLQKDSQDSSRDPEGEKLIGEVLESLAKLMGGQDPRACLYQPVFMEDDGDPKNRVQSNIESAIGLPTSLEYVDHRGRSSDQPRKEFLRDDDRRHGMISVFDTGEPQFVEDTSSSVTHRGLSKKEYKTFVNVRTGIGPGANGVLSVDSCTPRCLDQGHVSLMLVFAKLLAVGMDKRLREENRAQREATRSTRNEIKP